MTEIEVCVDCMHVLANGAENDEQDRAAELMNAKWEGYHLIPGESDYESFSWNQCDGCGSSLGGSRFQAFADEVG